MSAVPWAWLPTGAQLRCGPLVPRAQACVTRGRTECLYAASKGCTRVEDAKLKNDVKLWGTGGGPAAWHLLNNLINSTRLVSIYMFKLYDVV